HISNTPYTRGADITSRDTFRPVTPPSPILPYPFPSPFFLPSPDQQTLFKRGGVPHSLPKCVMELSLPF
ncbi:unnamed protein product, partial [Candidula unifasciata]